MGGLTSIKRAPSSDWVQVLGVSGRDHWVALTAEKILADCHSAAPQ
ncbi:hypothetical protein [Lapillicoccus sp.]